MDEYCDPLAHKKVKTEFRKLDLPAPQAQSFNGRVFYSVTAEQLSQLAFAAFHDINHYLRPSHLAQLASILSDPEASPNDKFVALDLLKNANIASSGVFPMCQDTGTAIIMGKKGRAFISAFDDRAALAAGVKNAYQNLNLRYSQLSPKSMFDEVNTKDNLPAQIEIYHEGDDEYHLLFLAKGGGSANKTFLYQASPSQLEETKLLQFLEEKLRHIGTSACPPYHLSIVIGGLSAELNLKTVKLASARYLDGMDTAGGAKGASYRDLEFEQRILKITQRLGIGAQFGGKYFCHDVRVIRMARHGASLPIGIGVSCAADRQVLAKITKDGFFLEQLATDPAQFLPDIDESQLLTAPVPIDLNQPMAEILKILHNYPIKTRLSLSGTMIVARDLAHRALLERLESGQSLPEYFKNHPIYYAGPAKTPAGEASGSFGPTTAGRMDGFVARFQAAGGSMVMLAKGNRSAEVTRACQKYGGFYLGSIGGVGARLGRDVITKVEVLDFAEFGMEAVWRIEVKDMPAFVVIDDKGNDFFQGLV